MFELVDLDQCVSKEESEKLFPELEIQLGQCQREARAAGAPVILVLEGWSAAGKGTLVNRLSQALDPRGFKVHPIFAPTETERLHPWMWRFWELLPAAGSWAIFDHSWYRRVLAERIDETAAAHQWRQAFEEIRQFERLLTDGGAILLKFWLHVSRREQKRRFKRLQGHRATAWQVDKEDRRQNRDYAQWLQAAEDMIDRTDTAEAPWTIVEASDRRFARLKVSRTIVEAVRAALARRAGNPPDKPPAAAAPVPVAPVGHATLLDRADMSLTIQRDEYEQESKRLQKRLYHIEHELYLARVPAVILFEGWDAGGKGGAIKRLTRGLDPRGYEVIPVAAPTPWEKAHHYLWRFWKDVPKAGHITIYDRSWYGRVLVERVEGFCSEAEWKRAYAEINDFERQLADAGTVLVKFWLQIDADEQLRRFQERQQTPYKQWKITDEDWRNREKRGAYEPAVAEMFQRTSTAHAPWTILEANCKLFARIKALRTAIDAMKAGLRAKGS
jgi:polyphosphate:AMP phosphotransferase